MIAIGIIYIAFLVGMILSRNYGKEHLVNVNKKEHPLYFLYPFAWYLVHFIDKEKSESHKKRLERIKLLHANEDYKVIYQFFMAKKFAMVLFCIILFNSLGVCLVLSNHKESKIQDGAIKRPSYGESSLELQVDATLQQDGASVNHEVTVDVLPRQYSKEEFEKAAKEGKEYLEKAVLGDNVSLDKIYYPLNLISSIPNTAISVEWKFGEENWIKTDGTIEHEGLKEEKKVTLGVVLKSEQLRKEEAITLTLLPEVLSKEDALLYELHKQVDEVNEETVTKEKLQLPDSVNGYQINYKESKNDNLAAYGAFAILVIVLVYLLQEQQLQKQKEERDIEIMLDYPELVNKFTLLIGAGMTIKKAWEKIVCEYEEKKHTGGQKKRYAYEELKVTLFELQNGVTESRAYEAFGRRMQLMPYMKFSAMLAQNVSKGMDGILASLELEALSAFEDRKELAKRLGEKAGTKLLLPMGIMFCLVMAMIIVPAIHMM